MLKYNFALIAGSLALFGVTLGAAALSTERPPNPNEDRQIVRKQGDMVIFYRGRGYRSMSSRRGSLTTRGFRGGGLRGGK